jgi:hypothetical protein
MSIAKVTLATLLKQANIPEQGGQQQSQIPPVKPPETPWYNQNLWGKQTGSPYKNTDLTSMKGIGDAAGQWWEGIKGGHAGTLAGTGATLAATGLLGSLLLGNKRRKRSEA